jgi:hypothetical protein
MERSAVRWRPMLLHLDLLMLLGVGRPKAKLAAALGC